MHPYLTRLGVSVQVQQFFAPFYAADDAGNLCFRYGEEIEHFGFAFHRIPVSPDLWVAGNLNFSQIRQVIICGSALDAVSWLNKKAAYLSQTENLLFLSTGASLQRRHITWVNEQLHKKQFCMIYSNDLIGRLTSLKMAAGLKRLHLEIYIQDKGKLLIIFRSKMFSFRQENFSINAFQKAAKFRFGMRSDIAVGHLSFFDELKAHAFQNI